MFYNIFKRIERTFGFQALACERILAGLIMADQQEMIQQTLNHLQKGEWVQVTYFQPIKVLDGQLLGEYTFLSAAVKKLDDVEQLLVLEGGFCSIGKSATDCGGRS